MKKIFISVLIICSSVIMIGQNRTFNTITAKQINEIPYGTINMADYYSGWGIYNAWKYRKGTINLIPETNMFSVLWMNTDTVLMQDNNRPFFGTRNVMLVKTADEVENTGTVTMMRQDQLAFQNYRATQNTQTVQFINRLQPEGTDTIEISQMIGASVQLQSYTPDATTYSSVGEQIYLDLWGSYDNYLSVDSIIYINIRHDDTGIDPDSIGAVYGIYNEDGGLRGADKTYFLYSEYGDMFLGGGGELDQYGYALTIGANPGSGYTARADATAKGAKIVIPHYTNAEEGFSIISGVTTDVLNSLYVGGGNASGNAATTIYFYTAANNTTTIGTKIAEITTDGLEILSGAFKQVQLTGSLTDGAPTDAEIDAVVGDTPANMGAGWTVTIKDNDGTGLLYRVESDGTNWFYWISTQAT